MKLFTDFKNLPKGIKRTIIIGSIVLPLIAGGLMTEFEDEWLPCTLILWLPVYWVLALAGVWIYEGFKEDKTGQK